MQSGRGAGSLGEIRGAGMSAEEQAYEAALRLIAKAKRVGDSG